MQAMIIFKEKACKVLNQISHGPAGLLEAGHQTRFISGKRMSSSVLDRTVQEVDDKLIE